MALYIFRPDRFTNAEAIIFVFKMHQATNGVVDFCARAFLQM
jgi:hypothetical protein